MKRRNFLKSIGASALLPIMPTLPSAAIVTPVTAAAPAFSNHTYQWAEMIVRAHNKCNLGLLQRSLHIDASAASALKSKLIENGVVNAQANAYGIHKATKPLYEEAFMKVSDTAEKAIEKVTELIEDSQEQQISDEPDNSFENYDLDTVPDSETEEKEASQTEASLEQPEVEQDSSPPLSTTA